MIVYTFFIMDSKDDHLNSFAKQNCGWFEFTPVKDLIPSHKGASGCIFRLRGCIWVHCFNHSV